MQSTSNQKGDKVVASSLFILFIFFLLFIKNIYTYINVYSTSEKKEVSVISKILKWGVL